MLQNEYKLDTQPAFPYNQNINPTFDNNNVYSNKSRNDVFDDVIYSPSKGINYTRNENENKEFLKSNSEDYSKLVITNDLNNDIIKRRSNKTIHIVSNNKNDLSQTNKIFERNNNEIYFSKRK